MASIALYYPWMHFQDTDWLTLALLSWERVVRLRPRTVDDRDSEVVREIRGESDLLREITPSRRDLETVADASFEILGYEDLARELNVLRLRTADPTLCVAEDFTPPPSQRLREPGHGIIRRCCGSTAAEPAPRCRSHCGTN
ncbi:hypothetical protein [Streptomyces sp. NBC_01431]|uniref:hypothetical protein n=1 Tax=Streptomyces sp. NBC_01431 TaxID=2903863 RepID=UPI002E31A92E|nr:hypothetical protein [Streptomyces sp. NBC_01431]